MVSDGRERIEKALVEAIERSLEVVLNTAVTSPDVAFRAALDYLNYTLRKEKLALEEETVIQAIRRSLERHAAEGHSLTTELIN